MMKVGTFMETLKNKAIICFQGSWVPIWRSFNSSRSNSIYNLAKNEFQHRKLSLTRGRKFSFIFPCDILFFYSGGTYAGGFCNVLPLFEQLLFAMSCSPPNSFESNLYKNPRSATLGSSNNQAYQSFSSDQLLFSWSVPFYGYREFSTTFFKLVHAAFSFLVATLMRFWMFNIFRICESSKHLYALLRLRYSKIFAVNIRNIYLVC